MNLYIYDQPQGKFVIAKGMMMEERRSAESIIRRNLEREASRHIKEELIEFPDKPNDRRYDPTPGGFYERRSGKIRKELE